MTTSADSVVDTHCHLDLSSFDDDRDAVIERAAQAGVRRMVVPAVDLASVEHVIGLADRYPPIYVAVGVHPNDLPVDKPMLDVIAYLRDMAAHPKVVAIGEIGLDYHWKTTPRDVQLAWLRQQLELANEMGLPVILHNRESTGDMLATLLQWTESGLAERIRTRPGVLHSFSATWRDAEEALELGFYLGFAGPITYKNAEEIRKVSANIPDDRMVVETDAPFLTPHPHRGERNEPGFVAHILARLAEVRGIRSDEARRLSTQNACELFAWGMAFD